MTKSADILFNFLLVANTALLIYFIKFGNKKDKSQVTPVPHIKTNPKPFIIVSRDGVDVTFTNPYINGTSTEEISYRYRIEKIRECVPFMREYDVKGTQANQGLIIDLPDHIPLFKEKESIVDYEYSKPKYDKIVARDWHHYNPIRRMKYYRERVPRRRYDDIPGQGPDFKMPNMGMFNDPHYCDYHDIFLLNYPHVALKKFYFFSDYHQLSLPRFEALGHFGKDTAPKISKNMKKLNWFQRLTAFDPRTTMFYTKKAGFHTWHEIGRHFVCWGQAYNHIPGHGHMIRKDLLVTSANDYIKRFKGKKKCLDQVDYFPISYRLYDKEECQEFFRHINTPEYPDLKKESEIQFVLKTGFGVHRGEGVYLLDNEAERNIIANYSDGKACGKSNENIVAQKYYYNPLLLDGFKFDFRQYMLIASVDPLIIYYHDGFLRVSLFPYSNKKIDRKAHLTNTELAKKVFKQVDETGEPFMGMNSTQLREFQMRTLDQFEEWLIKKGKKPEGWVREHLVKEFQKAYLHCTKMIEEKLERNPNLFEVYGVDFVIEEDYKIYVVEVNASPMQVGTSQSKTKLMRRMNRDLVKIQLAYLRSRVTRTINFVRAHKSVLNDPNTDKKTLKELGARFRSLYRNQLMPEYEKTLQNIAWEKMTDESIGAINATTYNNLVEGQDCIEIMNNHNPHLKNLTKPGMFGEDEKYNVPINLDAETNQDRDGSEGKDSNETDDDEREYYDKEEEGEET